MTETRSHIHQEEFSAPPERIFALLVTPSAIRQWWGASRVIVDAREGGVWTAAWGDEDDPDYISTATLTKCDPPRQLVMKYGQYYAKSGKLPFEFGEDAVTIFTVEKAGEGSVLRVEQTGFPIGPEADDFYTACETGWRETFNGIRRFIEEG